MSDTKELAQRCYEAFASQHPHQVVRGIPWHHVSELTVPSWEAVAKVASGEAKVAYDQGVADERARCLAIAWGVERTNPETIAVVERIESGES